MFLVIDKTNNNVFNSLKTLFSEMLIFFLMLQVKVSEIKIFLFCLLLIL